MRESPHGLSSLYSQPSTMYQQRFRNRNVTLLTGPVSFENFAVLGGGCSSAPTWWVYGSNPSVGNFGVIDTIDDIAGDPPRKSQGLAGYRFHPMTRVKVGFSGGGDASWTARNISQNWCVGTPNQHQILYRRKSGTQNASQYFSSAEMGLPMLDNRLDLARVPYPADEVASLRSLAETGCLSKRGKYGDSNLYEALFEVNKTLGMVKEILDRAHRIQDVLFKRTTSRSRLRSLSDEAAGQYLLTRYGFGPLVKDISALLLGLDAPLGRMLRTTRDVQSRSSQQTAALSDYVDAATVSFTRTMTTTSKVTVKAISLDNVELTLLGSLGLGYKDLVTVLWELKSHSFIVDWFANVGDYLGALVPDMGLSNIGMTTVTEWECIQRVVYGVRGVAPGKAGIISIDSASPPPSLTRTISYKHRDVGAFAPTLAWKSDFKFDNLLRVLDSMSLLAQKMKRIRPPQPTALDEVIRLRRRQPSTRGVRRASDFTNLTDR